MKLQDGLLFGLKINCELHLHAPSTSDDTCVSKRSLGNENVDWSSLTGKGPPSGSTSVENAAGCTHERETIDALVGSKLKMRLWGCMTSFRSTDTSQVVSYMHNYAYRYEMSAAAKTCRLRFTD